MDPVKRKRALRKRNPPGIAGWVDDGVWSEAGIISPPSSKIIRKKDNTFEFIPCLKKLKNETTLLTNSNGSIFHFTLNQYSWHVLDENGLSLLA